MDVVTFNEIRFDPSSSRLLKKMRVKKGSGHEQNIKNMIEHARQIGRPKAMFTLAGIDEIHETGVVIAGIELKSRILSVNLEGVNRAFPYLVTSGRELYNWKESQDDILGKYYADEIGQMALLTAEKFLLDHLKNTFELGQTASMNPGSLPDWPITSQRDLFSLLGNQEASIGVELLDSMLMLPNRTVSGIRFVSDEGFSNCELCPRDNCSHRRSPYDPKLLEAKYQKDQ
jgi:hypothetical protein